MYSEILEKNMNDCSIPVDLLLKLKIDKNPAQFIKDNVELIVKEIIRCYKDSKGKKAVALPISFKNTQGGTPHANMLIFNTLQMTAEHFEPHGAKDYLPARKQFIKLKGVNLNPAITILNKELKKQASKEGLKEFSKGLKYIRPVDVCPSPSMYKNFKGVQSLDRSKKEGVQFEGFTIKEIGYCSIWSYFLLDLRLKTLNKPPQEVLKEYATYRDIYKNSIGNNPNKTMMGLIRGYSRQYFDMIRKLINEGKFTLEEFLKYRDYHQVKKGMSKEQIKFLDTSYNKIKNAIFEEASKKMERVMKNTM